MCGICGITSSKTPGEALEPIVQRMTATLEHRGPDAGGVFIKNGIGLGHRRLAIIDLDPRSHQPFHSPDGRYTIVYNGEIYNYREIRSLLPGYPFRTQSDTEVLLAAYIHWGIAGLSRLNGMFAFAIWDQVEQTLLLARDRLGIKPLYYSLQGDQLLFASEIRTLLASGVVARQLNHGAVADFLTYQSIQAPETIIESINLLEAGTVLQWQNNTCSLAPFWIPRPQAIDTEPDRVKKSIHQLLSRAVERRLISDVPLGAFLSGGIDSSIIVALMREVSGTAPHTFSVVFDEPEYDESPYSRQIAAQYQTIHTPIPVKPIRLLEVLEPALGAMDSPSGDGINSYLIAEVVKSKGITVALSGLGGDELFAGYPNFLQLQRLRQRHWLWKLPHTVRRLLLPAVQWRLPVRQRPRFAELVLEGGQGSFTDLYPILRKLWSNRQLRSLLTTPELPPNAVLRQLEKIPGLEEFPGLSQTSLGELNSYTQNTLLRDTDQMSMAHALEVRVPFFDHELVEYVLSVPDELKYPHYPKQLLVEATAPLLPEEIVFRKKMGFVFPWANWLKTELRELAAQRIASISNRPWIQSEQVQHYWQGFLRGDPAISWMQIWTLIVLEEWLIRNAVD